MKKFLFYVYTFFHHLFTGLRNADTIAFSSKNNSTGNDGGNIEIKDEAESVYKDLLRGEVTQAVKDLRYETYHSERESHKYRYSGGGTATKKKYDTKPELPCYEGYDIQIVQDNIEDTGSVVEGLNDDEVGVKNKKEYTIFIERTFTPRFRLEEYVNKVVVERDGTEKAIIDLYVTKYESQFDRRHRPFLNEINRIVNGDTRSDVIDFDTLKFVSFKAYGADDLHLFSYCAFNFKEIREYNGEYILSFDAIVNEDGTDLIKEFDDKISEYKFKNNLPRDKKMTIDYYDVIETLKEAEILEDEKKIIGEYKTNKKQN